MSKRQCTHTISSFCSYNHLSSYSCSFIASLDSISLPNKVSKVLAHLGWRSAMIEEMDILTDNGTWDLVLLPTEKKAIGCRWVFTVKVNPNGSIARLKARLVAKGYAQTYGVDYSSTFSPVAKLTSIRLFISLGLLMVGTSINLILKMFFFIRILRKRFIWSNLPGLLLRGR